MAREAVNKLFETFATKKILVVGDVMIDSYLWGKVERISPEAPVPVVSCNKRESRLGGAANVALNLSAIGVTPVLCGVIGNDDNGTLFLKLMQDNHLLNAGICIVKGRPTTVKTRIIGGNQHLLRVDEETDKPVDAKNEAHLFDHISKLIHHEAFDAIIFQDYDKGTLTEGLIKQIVTLATQKGIPMLVDPKKRNFHHYEGVTLFKPNFKEFCEGLKIDLLKSDSKGIFEASKIFLQQTKTKYLLLTLSERGVIIAENTNYHLLPAHVREIADVSGAGDTVISLAGACIASGLNALPIAAIANLAGGLVCESVGVVPVELERLKEEVDNHYDAIFGT